MKLTGLISLLAVLTVVGNLSFSPAYLKAAEKAKGTRNLQRCLKNFAR